uniref:Uncharacterized protein n=1 Tax=Glossina pallidipes TaxID=7398 RepID=A0A1B0AJM3_GLOPL
MPAQDLVLRTGDMSRFSIVTESNRFTTALPMPFDIADALNNDDGSSKFSHYSAAISFTISKYTLRTKQNNTLSETSYFQMLRNYWKDRSVGFIECPSLTSINSGIGLSTSAVEIAANASLELEHAKLFKAFVDDIVNDKRKDFLVNSGLQKRSRELGHFQIILVSTYYYYEPNSCRLETNIYYDVRKMRRLNVYVIDVLLRCAGSTIVKIILSAESASFIKVRRGWRRLKNYLELFDNNGCKY